MSQIDELIERLKTIEWNEAAQALTDLQAKADIARSEGFRAGIEAAAKVAADHDGYSCVCGGTIAQAIRAIKETGDAG